MIIKEIKNRRSCRRYKKDDVPFEYIREILIAGYFAPTARGNKAIEFIVIKDKETKNKIFEIVGQDFIKEAPFLIIPVTDITKTNCPVEDLSAVTENILLQATALGLGSVWKAIKREFGEYEEIKKLLAIPDNFLAINIIPIGYPEDKIEPHKEEEFSEKIIHLERW